MLVHSKSQLNAHLWPIILDNWILSVTEYMTPFCYYWIIEVGITLFEPTDNNEWRWNDNQQLFYFTIYVNEWQRWNESQMNEQISSMNGYISISIDLILVIIIPIPELLAGCDLNGRFTRLVRSFIVQSLIYLQGHMPVYPVVDVLGPYSLSDKTSYHYILWSIVAARLGVKMAISFWHLGDVSAALMLRRLSNFGACGQD